MRLLDWLLLALSVASIAYGCVVYRELWKWAKQCQSARIAIAYNRKVKLEAPLTEWLQWANTLGTDDASRGRVVYTNQKTSVAILRPRTAGKVRQAIWRARGARRRRKAPPVPTGHLQTKGMPDRAK